MMKKLSKLALLAAATAFLLAGFPACGHDDEDGETTVETPSNSDNSSPETPENPIEDEDNKEDEADKDKDANDKSDEQDKSDENDKKEDENKMTYTLESSALAAMDAGGKKDGDTTTAGTADYFTIYWSANMKVDASSKTWDDGYSSEQRISMSGVWTSSKQFIKFTTSKAATVKVWWVAGDAKRTLDIAEFTGSTPASVTASDGKDSEKNGVYLSSLTLDKAGTWALGSAVGGNYIFKIEVTE